MSGTRLQKQHGRGHGVKLWVNKWLNAEAGEYVHGTHHAILILFMLEIFHNKELKEQHPSNLLQKHLSRRAEWGLPCLPVVGSLPANVFDP